MMMMRCRRLKRIDGPAPSAQDAPRLHKLNELYEKDPGFLDDLLKRFFSPEFRTGYYRATKKQPPSSSQNQANPPSGGAAAADAELGFPTEPSAVLSVTHGFKDQAPKPVAGMPVWLLNDSFGSLLRRTGLLDGPPGAKTKVTPLRAWATSCFTSSPICGGMLSEVQGHIVGASKMDATGRATFQAVPPGSYYVLALSALNQEALIWDLRVDLKSGANSVIIDPHNITPIDAAQAQAGAKTIAATPCNVTPAKKSTGLPNSTLSLTGSGYSLTVTNQRGEVVRTERGNFSHTTFFLLDDDVENIWRNAGVRPFMGMSLMDSVSFYARLGDPDLLKGSPVGGLYDFIGKGLGADELPNAFQGLARGQYECSGKARRAHTLAEVITDANARGTFPKLPAGTYYLFGQFTEGHPLIWDLKIELKPGANTFTLSPKNAGWKYGASAQ
jgi:hypothetical protein